ncbi:MAG: non-ribosomal peptide synthetase, partial [bacterium]|nr:non-ribosomal peptide synthetase [bacterium]
ASSAVKIYKTGDLARWLEDGNIEFLGRIDHQVSIRGYRVELGEIETQLLVWHEIKEAVVVERDDNQGEKYLCAYIVCKGPVVEEGIPAVVSGLRKHLAEMLPDYMIPSCIVPLETIPLTPNGKIDRKALPEPGLERSGNYAAPRDQMERQLLEIWKEVLGRTGDPADFPLGIDDDFFQLGGHSLRATAMVSLIHKRLDVKLPLKEVFNNHTIRGLVRCIRGLERSRYISIETVEEKAYYILSSTQKRLYILQQMQPGSIAYNMPYHFPLPADTKKEALEESFRTLIRRHESLRTSFQLIDNQPVQRIWDKVKFGLEYRCMEPGRETPAQSAEAVEDFHINTMKDFIHPFDLQKAPLLRGCFLEFPGQAPVLLLDIHHIISDGASGEILKMELDRIYREERLPELKLRYRDY